ncbi:hypothetical protein [Streptomyces prunicolor]
MTTAVRALHLAPAQATALSAVAGHLGPRLLRDGSEGLVPVRGRHAHNAYGVFGTVRARLRELAAPSPHGLGSLGVLAALSARGKHRAAGLPEAVHAPGGPLPPPMAQPVTATPAWFDPRFPSDGLSGPLGALVRLLAREASVVRTEFGAMRASVSAPALRAAADRYALLPRRGPQRAPGLSHRPGMAHRRSRPHRTPPLPPSGARHPPPGRHRP